MEIDWTTWEPKETGVLSFIVQGTRILLIHKKRGLGAGKVNGPGGKIEKGESPLEAAVRECQEEIGITPLDLEERGEIWFQFTNGYSLRCHVFYGTKYEGELISTIEADPFWCELDQIPYHNMWEDDQHWIPLLLKKEKFFAKFIFEEERMLFCEVETLT
jgi:8-oxo-dGTP diphosphatase